jgi:hypothetical protein
MASYHDLSSLRTYVSQIDSSFVLAPRLSLHSQLVALPNELLFLIIDATPRSDWNNYWTPNDGNNKRRLMASLRQTCRRINLLFSDTFSSEYLSRLVINVDRRGLTKLRSSADDGFQIPLKHLEIHTDTMLDWEFAKDGPNWFDPPWGREFIDIYERSLWGETLTGCLPRLKGVESIMIKPPRSPHGTTKIELLRHRWAVVVEQLLPIALAVLPSIKIIKVVPFSTHRPDLAFSVSMSLSSQVFNRGKHYHHLTELYLTFCLDAEQGALLLKFDAHIR